MAPLSTCEWDRALLCSLCSCVFLAQLKTAHFLLFKLLILLAKCAPPHPGRDKSGPYALGIASLAVFGDFANSISYCCKTHMISL